MADVASTLRVLVGGEKVGFYRELGEQYDVRLRLAEPFRRDARALADVTVPAAGGALVRLGNLARLQPGMSPAQIDRYAQERQITVVSNLYQKPLGEAMQQALAIVAELDLPPGYQAVQLGQAKLMAEAFAELPRRLRARARLHLHGAGGAVRELRPPRHDHGLDVPGDPVRAPRAGAHRHDAQHLRDHGDVPPDRRRQEERDPPGGLHERPARARALAASTRSSRPTAPGSARSS